MFLYGRQKEPWKTKQDQIQNLGRKTEVHDKKEVDKSHKTKTQLLTLPFLWWKLEPKDGCFAENLSLN